MIALLRSERDAWQAVYAAGRALCRLNRQQIRAIEVAGNGSTKKKDDAHTMAMLLLRLYRQFVWEDGCTSNRR